MVSKGPGILREQNQKKVLSLLRIYKKTSRKDIAKLMGVSKNTVSIIVDQYIKDGIIKEVGVKDPNKAGRPKILIELNPNAYKAIGLVIHHDGIEFIVTNYYLHTVKSGFEKVDSKNPVKVMERAKQIIQLLLVEHPEAVGIGIGIPGIVNSKDGIVYESTNLEWKNIEVKKMLKDTISIPIIIQNNVKMASLCSSIHGEDFSKRSFFYIRIGDGIGGALIINGNIWNGDSWTSGEIGHISVNPNGAVCGCGQKGCLEKMISKKVFNDWLQTSSHSKDINIEVELGKYGEYLGVSLISIINLINPGKIVIDSPYNQSSCFKNSLMQYLNQNSLKIPNTNTQIYFNEKPYSQSLGAATAVILDFEKS